MRTAILAAFAAAVITLAAPAVAQLEDISAREAVAGLRAALDKGSRAAVDALGRSDGFFGNPQVKIPLPESLARAERTLRRLGLGRQADELILTMNRAAEAAVPEARQLLVQSVKTMTVEDAKAILKGGETAATDFFRRSTREAAHARFLPIVKQATAKLSLAQKYNAYAEHGVALGLIKKDDADLDQYVTAKALDGLYFMVAEEEKKIRRDPAAAGTAILRKVFAALQR